MSVHPTKLKVRATGEFVDANLHDELGLNSLLDAEAHWAPARIRLVQKLLEQRIRQQDWPQSLHWNWVGPICEMESISIIRTAARSVARPVAMRSARTRTSLGTR